MSCVCAWSTLLLARRRYIQFCGERRWGAHILHAQRGIAVVTVYLPWKKVGLAATRAGGGVLVRLFLLKVSKALGAEIHGLAGPPESAGAAGWQSGWFAALTAGVAHGWGPRGGRRLGGLWGLVEAAASVLPPQPPAPGAAAALGPAPWTGKTLGPGKRGPNQSWDQSSATAGRQLGAERTTAVERGAGRRQGKRGKYSGTCPALLSPTWTAVRPPRTAKHTREY